MQLQHNINAQDPKMAPVDAMETSSPMSNSPYSSQSTPSEISPTASSFSNFSHRMSSSVSSCSSTPSAAAEPTETFPALPKKPTSALPDVAEDPMEKDAFAGFERYSYEYGRGSQDVPSLRSSFNLPSPIACEWREDFFSVGDSDRRPKRRRSELGLNSLAKRIVSRLPSLSKRSRENKRGSTSLPISESSSGAASPKISRSRSNSRTRSLFRRSGAVEAEADDMDAHQGPALIETITEDEDPDAQMPDMSLHDQNGLLDPTSEPLQRATTPLLPMVANEHQSPAPVVSALPSPRVVPQGLTTSTAVSPVGTVHNSAVASPALSTRPSLGAINERAAERLPQQEEPPMLIMSEEDEWSRKLGHADFNILPEPYLPDRFDRQSCDALLSAWETARKEFSIHLARTSTHFGQGSKTYQLSEEKWAEIDAQWRDFHRRAVGEATRSGETSPVDMAKEPAPIAKIPSMHDLRSEGKFPKLGDIDIVGPMAIEQAACPQIQRRASKKAQFMKMIDGFRFPVSKQSRSLAG